VQTGIFSIKNASGEKRLSPGSLFRRRWIPFDKFFSDLLLRERSDPTSMDDYEKNPRLHNVA
jgi:hypothetical protein